MLGSINDIYVQCRGEFHNFLNIPLNKEIIYNNWNSMVQLEYKCGILNILLFLSLNNI